MSSWYYMFGLFISMLVTGAYLEWSNAPYKVFSAIFMFVIMVLYMTLEYIKTWNKPKE